MLQTYTQLYPTYNTLHYKTQIHIILQFFTFLEKFDGIIILKQYY
jgi:hypothetical protein